MLWSTPSRTLLLGLVAPFFVHAAPPLVPDLDLISRASTCNTASNRACWTTGFDINTDYETSTPVTGLTKSYTLVVTEVENYRAADGSIKALAMLVNNTFPGPTIVADWGDRINITVINNLKTNGTSIHWHGLRQLNSNLADGANGVTECPIPPKGGRKTYSFLANQYGTSWYHSHFSAQYANGVVGTIQINGPASLPYDVDLGVFPISDWYHKTAEEIVIITKNAGPPLSDNVFFNGTNVDPSTGLGNYARVNLTPGKRHRLRIINTSADNNFQVALANHTMTVIASDFVPVNSQTVNSLFVGIGQRYDVTIDASKAVGNYWFNVTFAAGNACGGSLNPTPAAIFHYNGASTGLPSGPGATPAESQCLDLPNLTPVVTRTVDTSTFTPNIDNTLPVTIDFNVSRNPIFIWNVNGSAILVDWNKPVLDYILTGNTSYPRTENLVQVNTVNQWAFWLISNDPNGPFTLPHPIHLHGHDFVVLGKSPVAPADGSVRYTFNPATDRGRLNGSNPVRRDVTMLPAGGWIVIAFKTDNPGAWLMHCHIAWHVSGGLSVDFLERPSDLRANISPAAAAAFNQECANWRAYFPSQDPFPQIDSGLRI